MKKNNDNLIKYDLAIFKKSQKTFEKYLIQEFNENRKKLIKSKTLFIVLNILTFLMSATIVVLTMFVVGGGIGGEFVKEIFVAISIMTSSITLIMGISSMFQLKNREKIYRKRILELENILFSFNDQIKTNSTNLQEYISEVSDKLSTLDEESNIS